MARDPLREHGSLEAEDFHWRSPAELAQLAVPACSALTLEVWLQ